MHKRTFMLILVSSAIFLILFGCTKKPDPVNVQNQAPETFMVNVPDVSPDTLDTTYIYHARLIYWYGTDIDGIVTQYDWAIDDTVYSANIVGSGWHTLYMDSTLATQDTIAFEAPIPDSIYTHIFYVRAVDNKGKIDPTPAHRVFSTSNIPPNTRFLEIPKDSSQRFILTDTTTTWKGINFEWVALDSDMVFPCQFQYCWDDTSKNFDPVTHEGWSELIPPGPYQFTGQNAPFTEGFHTIYVRAVDDAGAIDYSLCDIINIDTIVTPDTTFYDTTFYNQWVTVYFVIPEIGQDSSYRKPLFINISTSSYASNYIVKPFYHSILDDSIGIAIDSLDYLADSVSHKKFGQYSTVIWSKGEKNPSIKSLADNLVLISDFLNVGGRIIFTGSQILTTGNFPVETSFGLKKTFPFSQLHIEKYATLSAASISDTNIAPTSTDTAFFNNEPALPFLSLDESIMWYFLYNNFLIEVMNLDLWGDYEGDLDILYTVNHYRNNAIYEGVPCATRFTYWEKSTPSFFYFGFPLSYLENRRATQLIRTVLTELGEI